MKVKKVYEIFTLVTFLLGIIIIPLCQQICDIVLHLNLFSFSKVEVNHLIRWFSLGTTIHAIVVGYVNLALKCVGQQFNAALISVADRDVVTLLRKHGILPERIDNVTMEYEVVSAVCDLLNLTMRYIHRGPAESYISDSLKSRYYVYTMSASHNKESLSIMRKYLTRVVEEIVARRELYSKEMKNEDGCEYIDRFVLIVPYGRNVILAEAVASTLGAKLFLENNQTLTKIPLLLAQSRPNFKLDSLGSEYETFYRNFFGCDELERYLEHECSMMRVSHVRLHGIVIDCNVTEGETFTQVVDDFNSFVGKIDEFKCKAKVKLMPIEDSAALFIASDKAYDNSSECRKEASLKYRFQSHRVRLWYYFILLESVKEKIVNKKNELAKSEWRESSIMEFVRGNFPSDTVKRRWINYKAKKFKDFIQVL